jgi:L-alanine-DL-glutamate epimerase-like enolase superfamily enzyme
MREDVRRWAKRWAMPEIESVHVCTASVPLERATAFSTRNVTERFYSLIRVRSADGIEGIGCCYVGHAGGRVTTDAVQELLAPLLVGRDSYAVAALWDAMYRQVLLHGRTGSVMRALSALDTALWDLNARAAGLPLYKYLGAAREDGMVPAYASGGYYLDGKTPGMLGEELAGYVAQGFRAVKMKVGRGGLDDEEARVRAARKAIGPDVLLMLDANNAWHDLPTAMAHLRRFERYDPYWIEEPFFPDDIENHARLARATPVPVVTGEIEAGRWRFKEILDKGAAAILQADALVCGGVSEWRIIAATASSYGVAVCPHAFHDVHAHLVASSTNGQYVEFFPDDRVFNFRRLIDCQLEVRDGALVLPAAPGLGFNFDEAAVERYAIDRSDAGNCRAAAMK